MRFVLATGQTTLSPFWLNVDYVRYFGHRLISGTADWELIASGEFNTGDTVYRLPGTYSSQADAQEALRRFLQGVDPSIYAT